ncbi:lysR substrate binding domain protein [Rhodococcus sp. MTM3W5.2]|nr:lysR substrate binding domain protein [Rhodococcus sp. MTM3W5.2]
MRSFVRAAELGQLQHAANELGVTQQAVSKRIATLERELEVRLFTRTARGVELTLDGQAFLPHARSIVTGVDRAVTAIRPGSRALRIDVLGLRSAQAVVLHEYWRSHPDTDLDVVTLKVNDPRVVVAAVEAGDIDASFRTVTDPATLPRELRMIHAFDSPLELLVGPRHPLASARSLTPLQLRRHRIWVPGIAPRSEWGSSTISSPPNSTSASTRQARTSATKYSWTPSRTRQRWPPSSGHAIGTSGRRTMTYAASRS